MPEVKVWPASMVIGKAERALKMHLMIGEVKHLPSLHHDHWGSDSSSSRRSRSFAVQIEWRGASRKIAGVTLPKVFPRSRTSRKPAVADGFVVWNEFFDHDLKMKRKDSLTFRRWIVKFVIKEFDEKEEGKGVKIGKAKVDISNFVGGEKAKVIAVPIDLKIENTQILKPKLLIKILFVDIDNSGSSQNVMSSGIHVEKQLPGGGNKRLVTSMSLPKHLIAERKPPQFLSEDAASRGLTGSYGGGIGEDNGWLRAKIRSRDGLMELRSDVFFASIDQRSSRADGVNACAALAAVVADWLLRHPGALPSCHRFNALLQQGSSEWRRLCSDDNLRKEFLDQRFDIETVMAAGVRTISLLNESSYVGFFTDFDGSSIISNVVDEEMSFNRVWDKVSGSLEQVYIVGWNDHFFVIKVDNDAIYLIDTLGERLYEGCNQAYILKFDNRSTIHRRIYGSGSPEVMKKEVRSQGVDCCKEYIKEFLAAMPLRELLRDARRGHIDGDLLHRLLQIDFHNTVTSVVNI